MSGWLFLNHDCLSLLDLNKTFTLLLFDLDKIFTLLVLRNNICKWQSSCIYSEEMIWLFV